MHDFGISLVVPDAFEEKAELKHYILIEGLVIVSASIIPSLCMLP